MAIRLICVCGKHMNLPDKYAGEHVQCPDCQAMLHVPSPEEDQQLTRWSCACGTRLKARAQSAGRKVKCPQCAAMVAVPGRKPPALRATPPPAPQPPKPGAAPPAAPPGGIDVSQQLPAARPAAEAGGEFSGELEAALEPEEVVEDIPLTPDDSSIEIPPRLADPADLSLAEPQEYAVEAPPPAASPRPAPAPPPAMPIARPAAAPEHAPAPRPRPMVAPEVEEEEDEGIRAALLTKYFNVQGGIEAAKAGVWQVVNGYWLYVPCALLYGCFFFLALLLVKASGGGTAGAVAALALPVAGGVFLLGALLGCVADGVFERAMGIERLLAHGLRHAPRVLGAVLLMSPLVAGVIVLWVLLAAWIAVAGGVVMFLLFLFLGMLGSVFVGTVVLTPLAVAVLERVNPFTAVWRGLTFMARHALSIIALTVASVLIGCGSIAVFRMIWFFVKPFLFAAPTWLYMGIEVFMAGLILSALAGQLAASIMLLYLSDLCDEDRLREIQARLRGPAARPRLLYAAIALAAAALFTLSSQAGRGLGDFEDLDAPSTGSRSPDADTDSEAPAPLVPEAKKPPAPAAAR